MALLPETPGVTLMHQVTGKPGVGGDSIQLVINELLEVVHKSSFR